MLQTTGSRLKNKMIKVSTVCLTNELIFKKNNVLWWSTCVQWRGWTSALHCTHVDLSGQHVNSVQAGYQLYTVHMLI